MSVEPTLPPRAAGRLAENVVHFARVLRRAGLPVGPHKVLNAVSALRLVGPARRDDFYWTLASVFLDKHEQHELFDQAFHIFWRDPKLLERVMLLSLPRVFGRTPESNEQRLSERVAAALFPAREPTRDRARERREIELDATSTFSARELLQRMDIESMSAKESADAKALIAQLRLPIRQVPTRRLRANARGKDIDMRATLRASMRGGGKLIALRRRAPSITHPPLVALCDISGSMTRYARMFLHFLHAITNDRDRVHTLVFGTRLTNVSRQLRHRDVDVAMDKISDAVKDWAGGTRIATCLKEFNQRWSRRLLGQNAVVLLISDGLDRDLGEGLAAQMQRLHRSCRQLIWLNPLLRFQGFEAKSAGIKAMLPHVDRFLPAHNLVSLKDLAAVLGNAAQFPDSSQPLARGNTTWK